MTAFYVLLSTWSFIPQGLSRKTGENVPLFYKTFREAGQQFKSWGNRKITSFLHNNIKAVFEKGQKMGLKKIFMILIDQDLQNKSQLSLKVVTTIRKMIMFILMHEINYIINVTNLHRDMHGGQSSINRLKTCNL